MNETGVSVKIGADSSAFLRGMDQVKAIAKAAAAQIQTSMATVKAPVPDIGRLLDIQKKQVFASNAAILGDTKKTVAQLKALLDQEAAAYQAANKFRAPEVNRRSLSTVPRPGGPGQWDHLAGTRFEGGTRGAGSSGGGGRGSAHGLGVGYNAIQDLVQGGPMAIANNVPQIIDLVAKSPALKMLGAAAFAAASGYFAYTQVKKAVDEFSGDTYRKNLNQSVEGSRRKMAAYNQNLNEENAAFDGQKYSEGMQEYLKAQQNTNAEQKQRQDQADATADLAFERQKQIIMAQKDRVKVERELAALQIQNMERQLQKAEELAAVEINAAEKAAIKASERYQAAKAELEAIIETNRREGTAMTDEEKIRKSYLESALPGMQSADAAADERARAARAQSINVAGERERLPIRGEIIQNELRATLGKMAEEEMVQATDTVFNFIGDAITGIADVAEARAQEIERLADQEKQKARLEKELQIAELQAGGGGRRAQKMQRDLDLADSVEEYRKAGYVKPGEAEAMAKRKQAVNDRAANPNRIRGAGADGPAAPRASGLDYFDRKGMGGPQTSALDDYAKRRAIPGVGGMVDPAKADREAAEAKKAAAPDGLAALAKESAIMTGILKNIYITLQGKNAAVEGG